MTKKRLIIKVIIVLTILSFHGALLKAAEFESLPEMTNGHFEMGEDGKPKYWKRVGDALFKWDDTQSVTPTHSGLIELTKENSQGAYWELVVDVDPEEDYRFSGVVKCENLAGKAQVVFVFLDQNGEEIAEPIIKLPEVTGTEEWKKGLTEEETPAEAYFVSIRCTIIGKGKAWFDNVAARPAGGMVAY
ncbi:MAG: hypothetical protein JRG73_12535 [Deltaproteobacteria bacterium]|nr:hypothetical protein [Deltaproteobacteria bacterium]MBW2307748.1 hypothetical protein [Deltaproteobacteria bacterium]